MNTERNCQSCKYYKDGYCENLELKPCYPQKGCDDFENKDLEVLDRIRVEIEKAIWEDEIISLSSDGGVDKIRISRLEPDEVLNIIDKYRAKSRNYEAEVITRGNCMMCGKELHEGLFFCKECEAKAESESEE